MDIPQILILILLALLVLALLRWGKKRGDDSRSARLMERYKHTTGAMLNALPDEALVEAAVCRVLGKAAQARRPDPLQVLAGLEHGPTVVYSVWAVCREMAAGDYATLLRTPTREVAELAAAGFDAIGATECAAAWRTLRACGEDIAAAEAAFHRAVESECPLTLCETYIRDHSSEFVDDAAPEDSTTQAAPLPAEDPTTPET